MYNNHQCYYALRFPSFKRVCAGKTIKKTSLFVNNMAAEPYVHVKSVNRLHSRRHLVAKDGKSSLGVERISHPSLKPPSVLSCTYYCDPPHSIALNNIKSGSAARYCLLKVVFACFELSA